jgi:hypothetical protein
MHADKIGAKKGKIIFLDRALSFDSGSLVFF